MSAVPHPIVTNSVPAAARALAAGWLVAFPTETVYGLGADAGNATAVRRVFEAKGRPPDHPLIVHLPDLSDLDRWATDVPVWARALARAIWPGPLTLVVPRAPSVLDLVTGGQPTVGIRVPDHPVALDLLRSSGLGVAGPSANRFGGVSPTTAEHVVHDLGNHLDPAGDLILDGGPCGLGLESTIIAAVDDTPRLLRPGAVGIHTVEALTGRRVVEADRSIRAPGTLPAHYSPAATVQLVTAAEVGSAADGSGFIAMADVTMPPGLVELARPATVEQYAHDLYAALREADRRSLAHVTAVPPAGADGLALAIRDRLRRAAHTG